ncbi:MAG: TrmH family RNA methyltransferase [Bacteroidia bacterium]
MLFKSEIKLIKSLKDKKARSEHQVFVSEGKKLTGDLLVSGLELKQLYCFEEVLGEAEFKRIDASKIQIVSKKEMEQMSNLQSTREVLALFHFPKHDESSLLKNNLILALDTIQDPGNLGTIIRIADWYGIKDILCTESTADCFNNKVIQSSMGSIGRVQVHYGKLQEWFTQLNYPVFAADMMGENINELKREEKLILLIGNEGSGISNDLKSFVTKNITIPRIGQAESLNAAVACAILTHQLLR